MVASLRLPAPALIAVVLASVAEGGALRRGVPDGAPAPQSAEASQICLEVRPSSIAGAGQGLFATCALSAGVTIGEYLGARSDEPALDNEYEWRVPLCRTRGAVIHGDSADDIAQCQRFGDVYVDGRRDTEGNLLRFVNGARDGDQRAKLSLAPVYQDGRLWYETTRGVAAGEELLIDYGPRFWQARDRVSSYFARVASLSGAGSEPTPPGSQAAEPSELDDAVPSDSRSLSSLLEEAGVAPEEPRGGHLSAPAGQAGGNKFAAYWRIVGRAPPL